MTSSGCQGLDLQAEYSEWIMTHRWVTSDVLFLVENPIPVKFGQISMN